MEKYKTKIVEIKKRHEKHFEIKEVIILIKKKKRKEWNNIVVVVFNKLIK